MNARRTEDRPVVDPRRVVAAEIIGGWLHIEPFCCDDLVDQILEAIDAVSASRSE